MLRIKFSMAVLGAVFALGIAATDAEARHCRHHRHQQRGHCHQGHQGHGHSGYGYSSHNDQNYGQQMNSNACCGPDQWQQNGSYQNQLMSSQETVGTDATPIATAPVSFHSSGVVNPPQPAVNDGVAPLAAPANSPAPAAVPAAAK